MNEIKNMNEKEIQEVINACNDELDRRKRIHISDTAHKALIALEELVKIAPDCYVDMNNDLDWNEDPVFLSAFVEQWKHQNFYFNY